jgi:hypothetical protein
MKNGNEKDRQSSAQVRLVPWIKQIPERTEPAARKERIPTLAKLTPYESGSCNERIRQVTPRRPVIETMQENLKIWFGAPVVRILAPFPQPNQPA